jgi:hypothetical protein
MSAPSGIDISIDWAAAGAAPVAGSVATETASRKSNNVRAMGIARDYRTMPGVGQHAIRNQQSRIKRRCLIPDRGPGRYAAPVSFSATGPAPKNCLISLAGRALLNR